MHNLNGMKREFTPGTPPPTPETPVMIVVRDMEGEVPQTDCKSMLIAGGTIFTCSREGAHEIHEEEETEPNSGAFYRITWGQPQ